MTNPRAESIAKAHNGEVLPIRSPEQHNTGPNKVDHYAALARVMHEAFEEYVASDEAMARLDNARSLDALRYAFIDSLVQQNHTVLHSDAFAAIHEGLQTSQNERIQIFYSMWAKIESNLEAGAHTFVNTAESLYGILENNFGVEAAASPDSSQLLDRMAKLSIAQFIPLRDTYIETPFNHQAFIEQLERSGTGVHFKTGYPLAARIPEALTKPVGMVFEDDLKLEGQPLIALKDIRDTAGAVGCPISFYSGQIDALWNIYTDARMSLNRRQHLGASATNFGGTEASL